MMSNITVKNTEDTSLMLEPTNTEEAAALAERLASSQLIPKSFQGKPNDVFVAMMWSRNLGLPIVQGLQNIAVINGRPSIWGDAALAIVKASGLLESFKETLAGMGDSMTATCTIVRKNEVDPYTASFSVYDAKLAGLWGKQGPWKQYPKRMLALRARGFALRNAFPDILLGIGIAEEEQDITPAETASAEPTPINEQKAAPRKPARKSAASAAAPIEDAKEVEKVQEPEPAPVPSEEPVQDEQPTDLFGGLPPENEGNQGMTVEDVQAALDKCSSLQEMKDLYNSLPLEMKTQVKQLFASRRAALGV